MDPSASSRSTSEPPRDSTSAKLHHTLFNSSAFLDGDDGSTTPSSAVNVFSRAAVVNNNNNNVSQSFPAEGGGLGRLEVERPLLMIRSNSSIPAPLSTSSPGDQNDIKEGEGVPSGSRKTMKKRKQTNSHCSCKKSNCLKRYCECFASESFCTESCRCKDCLNTVDYEDTVIESKERIESRMPQAFAPKIIPLTNDHNILQQDNNNNMRHRVGCNCRKSQCKKKYCECYKASVGCSSICRCQDCQNTFGIKDGLSGEVGAAEGKSETVEFECEMANLEQSQAGFFPATPYIQSSTSLDIVEPLAASGSTYHLSSNLDFWSSPNCSMGRIEDQASSSRGAENIGSFIPPPSPPPSHRPNGMILPAVSSLHLRMEDFDPGHNHEILKDSSSTMVIMEANSPNLHQSSPPHNNIQDA